METLNKVASAASEAIWGKHQAHEEPVSGKMGNVAAGEPYDAGNIGEPNEAALSSTERKDTEPTASTTIPSTTSSDPSPITTTTTGTSAPQPMPNPDPEAATKPRFVEATTTTTTTSPSYSSSSPSQPSNPAGPAKYTPSSLAMRGDSTKAQNDTRPPPPASDQCESHAGTNTKTAAAGAAGIADIKRDTSTTTPAGGAATAAAGGDAAKPKEEEDVTTLEKPASSSDTKEKGGEKKEGEEEQQEVKIEGPGPRPLEEIAREHGGDAGLAKQGGGGSSSGGSGLLGEAEGAGAGAGVGGGAGAAGAAGSGAGVETAGVETDAAGSAEGQNRRDSGKSLGGESGTGEEYIKSSGFSADGGDFDAAKAGAGREADRLLEVKGVHKGAEDAHGSHEKHSGHGIHGIPGLHGSHGSHGSHGNTTGTEAAPKEKVGLKEKIKAKLHKSSTSA